MRTVQPSIRCLRATGIAMGLMAPGLVFGVLLAKAGADEAPTQDHNPPSNVKVREVKWPGLVSIFHGHNWGDDEKYLQAIREAGFGAAGCSAAQIEQVAEHQMQAFVFLWAHEADTVPRAYRDSDVVLAYYLSDRQPPNRWGQWAALEKTAYQADPYHPVVFTMAPRAFGGVDQFLPVVRARIIEFYHYHWDANRAPHLRYAILDQIRQESLKVGGVPVCRIVETRADDVRKTRQTIFTSMAYGVRGFRTGGRGLFTEERDGRGVPQRTIHGEEALKCNRAIGAYSPVFERLRSVDVFHVAPLPQGAREAPEDHWMRPQGEEFLVGEFADGDQNKYLLVANRDAFSAREARLLLKGTIASVQKMDQSTAEWRTLELTREGDLTAVTLQLEEGGGELLAVKAAE